MDSDTETAEEKSPGIEIQPCKLMDISTEAAAAAMKAAGASPSASNTAADDEAASSIQCMHAGILPSIPLLETIHLAQTSDKKDSGSIQATSRATCHTDRR